MHLKVPYGSGHVEVEVPDGNFAGAIYPNEVEPADETEALAQALSNPSGGPAFDEFISDADEVLFVVNDATRSTPTARILEHVFPALDGTRGRCIVATGTHRPPTHDEYRAIFGKLHDQCRDSIGAHDAKKADEMVYVGTTARGTEVRLNRRVVDAKKIVTVGSVQPHYFAGYTGGRKAFLPGVAAYETIEENHRHAMSPGAAALALEGNPVHEDMTEALRFLTADRDVFAILAVLDGRRRMHAATAGDIEQAFLEASEISSEISAVRLDSKADIVVAVAPYPPVADLYQSQHALENGKLALADDGIIILVTECRQGIGNPAFVELASSVSTPEEALEKIDAGYRLGYHKIARMVETARWAEMWAVTDLDPTVVESVFMHPCPSVQAALDEALRLKPDAKVLFLMAANVTVPRLD